MTTITIDEKTTKGKKLVEFLKSISGEKYITFEPEPNETTIKAIKAVRAGKVTKALDVADLMQKLRS